MSGKSNCVFIAPKLSLTDLMTITISKKSPENSLVPIKIFVNSNRKEFQARLISDRIVYEIDDSLSNLPDAETLKIETETNEIIEFQLSHLIFLGPTKFADLPPDIYALEFPSGLYVRQNDFHESSVSFSIDSKSVTILDYNNLESLQTQLGNLIRAKEQLEQTKTQLKNSGIDLEQLSNLKTQVEHAMREKRSAQYRLTQQNQKMTAMTLHSKNETEYFSAINSLVTHLESNKSLPSPTRFPPEKYIRLLRFRVAALDELKTIFPFSAAESSLCLSHFYDAPQGIQWDENRSFLGFATHYVKEVAQIVGVPLQHKLFPLAKSSKIMNRLTNTTRQIPKGDDGKQMVAYAAMLIECIQQILEDLKVEYVEPVTIVKGIEYLWNINEENLKSLIPFQPTNI
ncbi:hypothetical protein GPJ56_008491 [Histomonas meleagridis]|uniref:uncharacterized protein n=1 Tax=Histomonas meleagridis TaxID=135588 RepID=UPI0035596A50|nr:hypothetical protein GPJ56_008491 [Histomonas meleagridis]KAH0797685.1 hypothetical protein GO595_009314 [Histomonas meleagridis]